ncbi:MAG TPA: MarR family transcriptional regulator [Actinomycetota bacterium]|nr:MarR family transcriptional regulator [Actinomycetota bacterium]
MDERNRDAGLTAWIALVEAHAAAVESVEADLVREAGMPLSWHEVLVRLSRSDERSMRMQELAKAVLLSKSGLTRLADRMETAGLIERTACDSDRRGTWAVITPKGLEALDRATPPFLAAVDRHFAGHLSPDEIESVASSLRKVTHAHDAGQCTASDLTEPAAARV